MLAEGYKRGDMYASFLVENSLTCVSNVYLTQNSSKDKLVSLVDIFFTSLGPKLPKLLNMGRGRWTPEFWAS